LGVAVSPGCGVFHFQSMKSARNLRRWGFKKIEFRIQNSESRRKD
jgi:hypothetical protein